MNKQPSSNNRNGGIAIALLLIAFTISVVVGAYLKLSLHNMRLNYRAISFQRARILAESVLDAGSAQLITSIRNKELGLSSSDLQSQLNEAAGRITPVFKGSDTNYVVSFLNLQLQHPGGFITALENGKLIEYQNIRIIAGVSNRVDGVHSSFSKLVRVTREPFLRYAIFFDELLELHPGPAMTVNGDIRSNSDIELWALNSLEIEGQMLCPGSLVLRKSDESDGYSTESRRLAAAQRILVDVDGTAESFYQDGGVLDSLNLEWSQLSREVWNNQVLAGVEVEELNPPIEDELDNHDLIEPVEASDSPALRMEKLAYKADLYITVSRKGAVSVEWNGTTVSVSSSDYASVGAKDSNTGQYSFSHGGEGWINVHDSYYDPRESEDAYTYGAGSGSPQQMQMVDLYMDQLLATFPGTSIVYVEVEEPQDRSLKPAVRLRNGADLSAAGSRGISLATHRTAYVEGNYNTTDKVPTLIAADNLTLLSNGWSDRSSTLNKPDTGSNTSLNAALMIGYADPENLAGKYGSTATGGAHNLLRFREDWTNDDYNFSGSYISLWTAQDSHCLMSGVYYSPPNRNITYDEDFRTTEPPGMPVGYSNPETILWEEISWSTALDYLKTD